VCSVSRRDRGRAREQQLTDDSNDSNDTTAARRMAGRARTVAPVGINPLDCSLSTGGLDMHAQVLRQSAARRALLDVDVFSAKPHPLACSIFSPVNSSDGACQLAWGASVP
jgi:hypothetical protein